MQVHLTKVYRAKQDKHGNPYLSKKTGKPYERVSIKTEEHGDTWLSGFGGQWNADWKEGDIVNVSVEVKDDYTNFNQVDPVDDLESRVKKLEDAVYHKEPTVPEDMIQIDESDIPF